MAEKFEEWIKSSWTFQQFQYKLFGGRKWDALPDTACLFKKKFELAFEIRYGNNYQKDKKNMAKVEHIEKQMLYLKESLKFNKNCDLTFINLRMKDDERDERVTTCVFWLQDKDGKEKCLDFDGRFYDSWNDFINNNKFPDCYMMYPKNGRYWESSDGEEEFAGIILEESVSRGFGRKVKSAFDVLAGIGLVGATAVLCFNPGSGPVLLGVAGVSIVSGAYSAGNNTCKLVDLSVHENGLGWNSKTLLTVGELVLDAAGAAAIGVSAGLKRLAAPAGKVFQEGSYAFKIANNSSKISKWVSGFNLGWNLFVAVHDACVNHEVTSDHASRIAKVLLYGFNVFAPKHLVERLIVYLAKNVPFERIFEYFLRDRGVSILVREFVSYSNDLVNLISDFFPDAVMETFHKFTKIAPVIESASIIVNQTWSVLKKPQLNGQDFVFFIFNLQKDLKSVQDNYLLYKKERENKLSLVPAAASNYIKQRTINNGIDLSENDSRVDEDINSLFSVERKIERIIKMLFKSVSQYKINDLFSQLCGLASKGNITGDDYLFVNRMNFFCDEFERLCKIFLASFHYEYFLFKTIKNKSVSKTDFITTEYNITNIREHIYNESLDLLKKASNYFHQAFEDNIGGIQPIDGRKKRIFHELTIANSHCWLKKEEFYLKAQELLPNLKDKLNENSTIFDDFEALNLSIITSKQKEFIVYFYLVLERENLKGFLLFDENPSCSNVV